VRRPRPPPAPWFSHKNLPAALATHQRPSDSAFLFWFSIFLILCLAWAELIFCFFLFAILFAVLVFYFYHFAHCARFAFNLCLCFPHNFHAIFCWFIFWQAFVYFLGFAYNFNYLPVEKGKSCAVELLVFIVEGLQTVWPKGVWPRSTHFAFLHSFFFILYQRSEAKMFALLLARMQRLWGLI